MKASFTGARTKSFKVLVMTDDREVTIQHFLNPKVWVSGVSVSKFRRTRSQQPDPDPTNPSDQ